MAIKGQSFLRAVLLIAASAGLSGCVYDVGLGFASDGYYEDGYSCDPYGGYDAYYNCDYGQAFSNIGFGGGWYDNYYYPGYGIFLFDTFGRRYPMREQYRRYWSEQRHNWYREHRGRDYKRHPRYERQGSPDRQEGRTRDRNDYRRDARRNSNDKRRGGDIRGPGAVPMPNTGAPHGQGSGQNYGIADGQPNGRGSGPSDRNTVPARPPEVTPIRHTSAEQLPESRPEPQGQQTPRQRMPEGGVERPN